MECRKTLAVIAICLAASACKPITMTMMKPEGPPDYIEGWQHGCDSGIQVGGTILQKMFYKYYKDPSKLDNAMYKMGWAEGFTVCRFYQAQKF